MHDQVLTLWREQINAALPEPITPEDMDTSPERVSLDALRHQLNSLREVSSRVERQVVALLSRRACDALSPVRSIPSQFRAMSSKRIPTESSYFVLLVMRPVKAFFGIGTASSAGARLQESFAKDAATEVFDSVCQRYSPVFVFPFHFRLSGQIYPVSHSNEEDGRIASPSQKRQKDNVWNFPILEYPR